MSDLISRQAAISHVDDVPYIKEYPNVGLLWKAWIESLPSAQPEITEEQAIEHLQLTGWMQSHDKEMYKMGLREKLADDSDSYDALLPSVQPEIIACADCKFWICHDRRCGYWNHGVKPMMWCSQAERRTDDSI